MEADQSSLKLFSVALVVLMLVLLILLLLCWILRRTRTRDVTELRVSTGPSQVLVIRTQQDHAHRILEQIFDRLLDQSGNRPGLDLTPDQTMPSSSQTGPDQTTPDPGQTGPDQTEALQSPAMVPEEPASERSKPSSGSGLDQLRERLQGLTAAPWRPRRKP